MSTAIHLGKMHALEVQQTIQQHTNQEVQQTNEAHHNYQLSSPWYFDA